MTNTDGSQVLILDEMFGWTDTVSPAGYGSHTQPANSIE